MLTKVDVDSENAFFMNIAGATPKDSLLIRKITGLDPPDIDLFIGEYARDGGTYQGRRVGKRNVVITFDLNPDPAAGETIAGLRSLIYKTFNDPFPESDALRLNFHDDVVPLRYLVGYTEKITTEVFDIDTMVQVSLVCVDPYIRAIEKEVLENPSGWTTVPFTYGGTAEAGFEATIKVSSSTNRIVLENNGKAMVFNRAFAVGDTIYINTNPGSRKVTIKPSGGTETSLIGALTPTSPWLVLHSQSNTMRIYGESTSSLPAAVTKLTFAAAYWGI